MNPMQHAVYKGTGGKYGAVQFNLQGPHYYTGKTKDFKGLVDAEGKNDRAAFTVVDGKVKLKEGWNQRQGCVFVECAPAVGKNKYDWQQKVIMALSIGDLGKILYFLQTGQSPNKAEREKNKGGMSIFHDPGAKSDRAGVVRKYIKFFSPNGPANGLMLTLESIEGDDKRSNQVPVTGDEVMVLRSLFTAAISSALNW